MTIIKFDLYYSLKVFILTKDFAASVTPVLFGPKQMFFQEKSGRLLIQGRSA